MITLSKNGQVAARIGGASDGRDGMRAGPSRRAASRLSAQPNIFLLLLPLEDVGEESDVFNGQPEDFVFAQLLLRRIGGHELPQLGKGSAHILLPPAFPTVAERLARENDERSAR